jgi:hypothetical protein
VPYSLIFASVNNFVPDKVRNLEDSIKMHSGKTEDLLVCCVLSQFCIHMTEQSFMQDVLSRQYPITGVPCHTFTCRLANILGKRDTFAQD